MASRRLLILLVLAFAAAPAWAQRLEPVDWARYRSRLSDRFAILTHDIPEALRADSTARTRTVRNAGFRVQLGSTTDLAEADRLKADSERWLAMYYPDDAIAVYVQFKQPFYKVHVGDFRKRTYAQEWAEILKTAFPDAWVVYDQIIPERAKN